MKYDANSLLCIEENIFSLSLSLLAVYLARKRKYNVKPVAKGQCHEMGVLFVLQCIDWSRLKVKIIQIFINKERLS